jgi:hypothetical protein
MGAIGDPSTSDAVGSHRPLTWQRPRLWGRGRRGWLEAPPGARDGGRSSPQRHHSSVRTILAMPQKGHTRSGMTRPAPGFHSQRSPFVKLSATFFAASTAVVPRGVRWKRGTTKPCCPVRAGHWNSTKLSLARHAEQRVRVTAGSAAPERLGTASPVFVRPPARPRRTPLPRSPRPAGPRQPAPRDIRAPPADDPPVPRDGSTGPRPRHATAIDDGRVP